VPTEYVTWQAMCGSGVTRNGEGIVGTPNTPTHIGQTTVGNFKVEAIRGLSGVGVGIIAESSHDVQQGGDVEPITMIMQQDSAYAFPMKTVASLSEIRNGVPIEET